VGDVWKFGDQYIHIDDGSTATPDEIVAFQEKHRRLNEVDHAACARAEELDRKWHAEYDQRIKDYYGYEQDRDHWDDDWLIYQLATSIFDGNEEEVKRKFPEYWKQALESFEAGAHDT
jgi:hypothetical protein